MRKLLTLSLVVLMALSMLISCQDNDGAPEGLELIAESDGFVLYCPEGWVNITSGYNSESKVYGAKLSNTSKTSFTFIKTEAPSVSYAEYFENSLNEFPSSFEAKSVKAPERATFGNAQEAYKAIYTYKYEAYSYEKGENVLTDFTALQFYVKNGDDFYLFTYTASGSPDDESGDYSKYLTMIYKVIENFEFGQKGADNASKDYPKDSDGYILVTDKTLCNFECYIPDTYTVINSGGSLDVAISGGASFNISKISSSTATGFVDYFDTRIAELQKTVTSYNEISRELTNVGEAPSEKKIVLGNLGERAVMAFEYSYSFGGKDYRTYQVMGMNLQNAFVFTYTAEAGEYSEHLADIDTILAKIKF